MKYIYRIFAAVMLACMGTVSCATFDDTEIQEAIKDLNDRVTALETAVSENVAAIQSMVSLGSVQSFSFNEETGKVEITLTDGKKLSFDMRQESITGLFALMV